MTALAVPDVTSLATATAELDRREAPFDTPALAALAGANPGQDDRLHPAYRAAVVAFTSSSVLGERAAAAGARRAARRGPATLAAGFRLQARDEARHARLDEARLRQLGTEPVEAAGVTPGVAREMAAVGRIADPLRWFFLTSFIGESVLAGATFPFVIGLAEANGDRLSARLNRARLADEERHTRFALRAFEILVAQDAGNRGVLQRWQDEHLGGPSGAFVEEVVPLLLAAPRAPEGDWLGAGMEAYRRRAGRLGLRVP